MKETKEITLDAFSNAGFREKENRLGEKTVSVGELTLQQLSEGLDLCLYSGGYSSYKDPYENPLENYEFDISSCILRNGYVEGLMLFEKTEDGKLKLVLLFSAGENETRDIEAMAALTSRTAMKEYSGDTALIIETEREQTDWLLEKVG